MESIRFTLEEKIAFKAAFAPAGATDDQWNLFINECQRRAMVPGKDVIFQLRSSKEYDRDLKRDVYVKKVIFITTIAGLRLIADRSGKYEGHGPFIFYYLDEDGSMRESKIPLGKIPHAVSVEGYRKDWKVPLFATARYDAYVQLKGDDKVPTQMWKTRGEEQLAKCCEAGMLRTVAPEECAGLLINEELGNDGVIDKEEVKEPVTPAVIPQATVAPPVNQQAAPRATEFISVPLQSPPESGMTQSYILPPPPCSVGSTISVPVVEPPAPPVPLEKLDGAACPSITTPPEVTIVPPPPAPPVQNANVLPTKAEREALLARAAKIVRDKLPKAGVKDSDAGGLVKNYFLKTSGKTGFNQIPAAVFEQMVSTLEAGTPEETATLLKAQK